MPRRQHYINSEIRRSEVRLIDEHGTHIGVVPIQQALSMAEDADLDLVEVSPDASPSVCKILDYSKEMYERKKKQSNSAKKRQTMKEIKFRPNIGKSDMERKMQDAIRHLENGNIVHLTITARGRELSYWDDVKQMLSDLCDEIEESTSCRIDRPKDSSRPLRNLTATITPVG